MLLTPNEATETTTAGSTIRCPRCRSKQHGSAQATRGPGPEGRTCDDCGARFAVVEHSPEVGYVYSGGFATGDACGFSGV